MAERKRKKVWLLYFVLCMSLTMVPGEVFSLEPEEIIALKNAGVDDETIRLVLRYEGLSPREIKNGNGARIVYSTGGLSSKKWVEEQVKIKSALKLLTNIIIDNRGE